jgi:hypothetical protein
MASANELHVVCFVGPRVDEQGTNELVEHTKSKGNNKVSDFML